MVHVKHNKSTCTLFHIPLVKAHCYQNKMYCAKKWVVLLGKFLHHIQHSQCNKLLAHAKFGQHIRFSTTLIKTEHQQKAAHPSSSKQSYTWRPHWNSVGQYSLYIATMVIDINVSSMSLQWCQHILSSSLASQCTFLSKSTFCAQNIFMPKKCFEHIGPNPNHAVHTDSCFKLYNRAQLPYVFKIVHIHVQCLIIIMLLQYEKTRTP